MFGSTSFIEFLINKETLKNTITSHTIDGHEKISNDESTDSHDKERSKESIKISFVWFNLGENNVSDHRRSGTNKDFSKENEQLS